MYKVNGVRNIPFHANTAQPQPLCHNALCIMLMCISNLDFEIRPQMEPIAQIFKSKHYNLWNKLRILAKTRVKFFILWLYCTLKKKFCKNLEIICPAEFMCYPWIHITITTYCRPFLNHVLGTSKQIFSLKTKHRIFYDHNSFLFLYA